MKEIWQAAHEELITEYLELHPEATEQEAYEATTEFVDDRFRDNFGSMIDRAMQAHKDGVFQ